jgi:shikimate kinase
MEWIKNNGYSIYLKASEDLLFKRLIKEKDGRPLISNMTDAELRTYIKMKLRERDKFYIQADFIASQTENEDISEELKLFLIEKLARDRS